MDRYSITVDGGTSATRAVLWQGNRYLGTSKRPVGVKETAVSGSKAILFQAVGECLEELMASHGAGWEQVGAIVAAGMLTSNLGLQEVPHLAAPAGVPELANGMVQTCLPEIAPVPLWLIPGIRNHKDEITTENFTSMDIMRGEEAETMALLPYLPREKDSVVILPGSHTKFVSVNHRQQITGCATSMTGELLSLLTRHSILSGEVDGSFAQPDTFDPDWMLRGFQTAMGDGLGRGAFATRLLGRFGGLQPEQLASYLLGAVLSTDLQALQNSVVLRAEKDTPLVLAGKEPIVTALRQILLSGGYQNAAVIPTPDGGWSGRGCLQIARYRGLVEEEPI